MTTRQTALERRAVSELSEKDLVVQLGAAGTRVAAMAGGRRRYPSTNAGPDPVFAQQNRRLVAAVRCG